MIVLELVVHRGLGSSDPYEKTRIIRNLPNSPVVPFEDYRTGTIRSRARDEDPVFVLLQLRVGGEKNPNGIGW
jgi:hypothetical protein